MHNNAHINNIFRDPCSAAHAFTIENALKHGVGVADSVEYTVVVADAVHDTDGSFADRVAHQAKDSDTVIFPRAPSRHSKRLWTQWEVFQSIPVRLTVAQQDPLAHAVSQRAHTPGCGCASWYGPSA